MLTLSLELSAAGALALGYGISTRFTIVNFSSPGSATSTTHNTTHHQHSEHLREGVTPLTTTILMSTPTPPPPAVLSSPLTSLSDIYDTIEKLTKMGEKQQKKSRLARLLTRSPRLFFTIGDLGDQVRNLLQTSAEDAKFFSGIDIERFSRVFESSLVVPLMKFAYLLSPGFMERTKKSERKCISVTVRRLANHLSNLAETLRAKWGSDDRRGPPVAYVKAQYLITRLRQVEQDWAPE